MEYRKLGRSGLTVSELCLGTMTFGRESDAEAARAIVAAALDAGVNFFDTANSYAKGASETLVGEILRERRQEVVIATKFGNRLTQGANDGGLSRLHLLRAVEDSLRRLKTDYIDLYYVHHIDPATPAEETLHALESLIRDGKVRYIGCSNYEAWRLLESLWISDTRNLSRFIVHQPHYNLLVRDIEDEILPVCDLKQVGVVPWGPLAGGLLSGKYDSVHAAPIPGTRSQDGQGFSNRIPFLSPNSDAILAVAREVARELNRTIEGVALRWLLEQPLVSSVIIGARTPEQVRANLGASGWRLPAGILTRLEDVSRPAPRYPRDAELSRAIRVPS